MKLLIATLCVAIASTTLSINSDPVAAKTPKKPDLDNIYHENENLRDDADVFPRMGKIEGKSSEKSYCRSTPLGRVVISFTGGSFMEINNRRLDRKGESWFRNADLGCWIHDSRIDLL